MDNHNLTELQQAERTARQALDRCYEGTAERGGYDVYAYCEARDAYREAVERLVRAEYEAWEPTVRRIAQTREPNLHELADLLRAAQEGTDA